MLKAMRIAISDERIDQLFLRFDHDGRGVIDAPGFIRHLFPKAFHDMYQSELVDDAESSSFARSFQSSPSEKSDIDLAVTPLEKSMRAKTTLASTMNVAAASQDVAAAAVRGQSPTATK